MPRPGSAKWHEVVHGRAVPGVRDDRLDSANGYTGELIHAADFRSPELYRGRVVPIVGAGNTGVDIAGHLAAAGARVSAAMRTPLNIFARDSLGDAAPGDRDR